MLGFEIPEEFPSRACPPLRRILQSLTDAIVYIGPGGNVEQLLIGGSILDDYRCLPVDRQNHGAFGFPELPNEVA